MLISDFDYYLPPELIAQTPLKERDHSRLVILNKGKNKDEGIEHSHFYNLPNYLKEGDTLVFNDTKVIPARLLGAKRGTGGKVEMLLLRRVLADEWEVLVKPGKKARPGDRIAFSGGDKGKGNLECEILSTTDCGGRIVRFFYEGVFETILDTLGQTPLPPYIKEKLADKSRYQTVYALAPGSAAAPTAGLHFTPHLLEKLKEMKVNILFVTLHVGLGTFRPVSAENISEHVMHPEYYSVSEQAVKVIEDTKKNGRRVIAVGTTAVRTLETAAREGRLSAQSGWTDIFIYPGYEFKVVDGLITNFHLPKSTLLMLVSALAGQKNVLAAYEQAVNHGYRFFSFGDAMLIL